MTDNQIDRIVTVSVPAFYILPVTCVYVPIMLFALLVWRITSFLYRVRRA